MSIPPWGERGKALNLSPRTTDLHQLTRIRICSPCRPFADMDSPGPMHHDERCGPTRTMTKRRITDILELIREFQALHAGKFPTTRSPFPRAWGSWNAIDGALRRDAIVQCQHFVQLKTALLRRGLTPNLARLDPSYSPPHVGQRRFVDILKMIRQSSEQHGGRFPLRTDPFSVLGYDDSWIAIDSALAAGTIVECPLWIAHRSKMTRLSVKPSLASLRPHYQPVRRKRRAIATIQTAIIAHMVEHAGKPPSQRAPFPTTVPADSWKAICKALRSGTVEQDADWLEFQVRLELLRQRPSLFTLVNSYQHELHSMFTLARSVETTRPSISIQSLKTKRVKNKPTQFAALVAQLFHSQNLANTEVDAASSNHRLARSLSRAKR